MIKVNELGVDLDNKSLIIDVSVKDNTYYEDVLLDTIYIDTQDTYIDNGPSQKCIKAGEKTLYVPEKINSIAGINCYKIDFDIQEINNYVLDLGTDYSYTIKIQDNKDNVFSVNDLRHPGTRYVVLIFDLETNTLKWDEDSSDYTDIVNIGKKHIRLSLPEYALKAPIYNTMFFVYVKTRGTLSEDAPNKDKSNIRLAITLNTATIYNDMMMFIKKVSDGQDIPKEFINYFLEFEAFRLSIRTGHNRQAINYFNKFFKEPITVHYTINNCYG